MTQISKFLFVAGVLSASALTGCAKTDASQPAAGNPPLDTASAPADTSLVRADNARIQGAPTARVWMIVSSDFQCPYCRQFHDDLYQKILKDYVATGKVRVAFLNHPMSFHQFAMPAAEAAMCAAKQDRFWEMHDKLFMTQDNWVKRPNPQPVFDSLATSLKLRMDDWRACVSTHATRALIESDLARSKNGGVKGTPSFFIAGQLAFEGLGEPYSSFQKALDAAIAQTGK